MKKIAIIGSSGFAREVADICAATGYEKILFLEKEGAVFGEDVISESEAHTLHRENWDFAIGIGSNTLRNTIAGRYQDFSFPNLIHPSVSFGRGTLENLAEAKGNIFCAGSRLTHSIKIGSFNIVNLNATIAHDCELESFIHISPAANISGNIFIGEGAMVGTNAAIINGRSADDKLRIGRDAVIGIGALVMSSVADGAKVIRFPEH